jgi:hypothetical protein
VQKIVDSIVDAEIMSLWVDLSDNPPEGTRFSSSQGCHDAGVYCYDHFASLGLNAEYQDYHATYAPNSIGVQEGGVYPDRVYIIEGHLDDLPSSGLAPGADDNASGTVTALAAAEALACWGVKSTVKYLAVTGEEQGLHGSNAYADDALARGEDIRGVINMDMNGWEGNGTPDPEDLDINFNGPSEWLGLLFAECAEKYGTGLVVDAFYCPSLTASDHYPFWQNGYDAICGITDNQGYCGHSGSYPYYHQSDDTIANCGDPAFFYASVRASVATLAELAEPFKITMTKPKFACGTDIELVVGDRDLDTDPGTAETVAVEVWSDTETAPETLVLTEQSASSMYFGGVMATTDDPPAAGDGFLSVQAGDTVYARYVDASDCDGSTDVEYTSTALVDCVGPLISNVTETNITDTAATIVWDTDEESDSVVRWGEGTPPGNEESDGSLVTSHGIDLGGLQSCTVYYYGVESTDLAGNVATDDSGGQYYHFETYGDFGDGLQPCHAGRVTIGEETYACTDTVTFRVVDMDLNADPGVADTTVLEVTSTTETIPEPVTVVETGPNTSVFTGSIPAAPGAAQPDGTIQVDDADILTVTYRDEDDGAGYPGTAFDTSILDCGGPGISNLRLTDVTDQRLMIRFDTDEPGDTVVEWGLTPALGEIVSDPALETSHAVTIRDLQLCERMYFRVSSTDAYGNTAVADRGGDPHEGHSFDIPGLYWMDDFESGNTGWSLEGEWQIGEPQGLGGSSGYPDPAVAYNNRGVLGHDLTGMGAHAGDYEPLTNQKATSPEQDGSTWTDTKLMLRRRLNVDNDDAASLYLWTDGVGRPLYHSNGQTVQEQSFTLFTASISAFADGASSVYLEFRQQANDNVEYSGWNVDDLIFKDGSLPDYGACGGCGTAPSFSGAVSASDNDACGADGVTVSWNAPVSWGSGGGGTYVVYRDTVPGFTPSASNRIASGVATLSYHDAAAPTDTTLYYLVRAESDETCGSGPNNGGMVDGNDAYVTVSETTSRPLPGEVTTVRVDMVNHAHARVSWQAVSDATSYRVYRSESAQTGYVQVGESTGLYWEDLNQSANGNSYYYRVVGVNACGQEGP